MQEATMSAPRECRSYVKKTRHAARGFRSAGHCSARHSSHPFHPLSNPFLFFTAMPRRAVPCRAGNSRGWRRNIFPWTWVRADMWNEARFAG